MSSKNKGADQLRGHNRDDLRISFQTYKKGFPISLYPWGRKRRMHLLGYDRIWASFYIARKPVFGVFDQVWHQTGL